MSNIFDFLQLVSSLLFIGTLVVGVYLFRNRERLFGVDPNIPSENGSARAYSTLQVWAIWAHATVLTGAFAFGLH